MTKPIIGITGNLGEAGCQLATAYYNSILHAGGVPVVIPPFEPDSDEAGKSRLEQLLDSIDGLLLSGGADINPLLAGEEPLPQLHGVCPERDDNELPLVRMAERRQMPMLGICRGIQVMATALGGSVYQDIEAQHPAESHIKHSQDMPRNHASHTVKVAEGSLLHSLYGTATLQVNSFHHQAVNAAPAGFRITAKACDGVIEAIEQDLDTEFVNMMGVQWHPECMEEGAQLFGWLVDKAREYGTARRLHRKILTIDSHEDTPMLFDRGVDFKGFDPNALVTLPRMAEGGLDAGIMVAYIPQGSLTDEGHDEAFRKANELLDGIGRLGIDIACTPGELLGFKRDGRPCVMLGVENGYALGTELSRVDHFAQRGCVYITLCHNGDNAICDSAKGNATHGGLSVFGGKVVERMNECGLMVDLSHAAESSFYDAIALSRTPIICSHSSSKALCNHPRNLTDEQLRTLARAGGVAQVTLYHGFLRSNGQATIADAMAHLEHMIAVAGIEHVGIGTDFDGDGGILGLANASEMHSFTMSLLRRRYSEQDIEAIWGGNLLRVMNIALEQKQLPTHKLPTT